MPALILTGVSFLQFADTRNVGCPRDVLIHPNTALTEPCGMSRVQPPHPVHSVP